MVEAAEKLHVSPSALTHRLREAERRLGVVLATKRGRRLLLTAAGNRLAFTARHVLETIQQSEIEASHLGAGISSVVRLASGFYNEYHWLPNLLKRVRAKDAKVLLELVPDAWNRPLASLEAGTIDIVILPAATAPEGFESLELFGDELVLLMAKKHSLAGRKFVNATDIRDYTFVAYWFSTEAVSGFENDRFFGPAKMRPIRYLNVESLDAVKEIVAAGLGVTIVSQWAVRTALRSGTFSYARLTESGIPIRWFAVTKSDASSNPAVRMVLSELAGVFIPLQLRRMYGPKRCAAGLHRGECDFNSCSLFSH
jgi:LysR family transcriptional regulator for metE and metH